MITRSSAHTGTSASAAKIQTKYQSGRGLASRIVGSGGVCSSGGPTIIASKAIAPRIATPRTTSRQAASGQNGTPSRSTCLWYHSRYVFGSTGRPDFGGSETPVWSTSQRWTPINANTSAGTKKTCSA